MSIATLDADTEGSLLGFPSINTDAFYNVYLPIELQGALTGLQGKFVAFKSTSADFRGIKGELDRNWNTFAKLQQSIMDLDLEPETTPTFVTVMSEPVNNISTARV